MYHYKQIVPAWFRDLSEQEYPGLKIDPAYWSFFAFLCFHAPRVDQDDALPISRSFLAGLEGKERDNTNGRYVAKNFLNRFQADVTTLNIRKPSRTDNRAREVREIDLNEVMQAAVTTVIWTRDTIADLVFADSGRKVTARALRKEIDEQRAKAIEMASNAGCQDALNLLDLLNNLGPYRFTAMLQHMDEARAVAATLSHAEMHLKMLRKIEIYCQPFYFATDRSMRVFASGMTLQGLHRSLRRILCQDWYECDLVAAHLAIIAMLWDIPAINTYLDSEANIWEDLCADLGIPYDDVSKDLIKPIFYALVYGDNKGNMSKKLWKAGLNPARFFGNPIVAEIYAKRQVIMKEINVNGGREDVYHNWIDTTKVIKKGKRKGQTVLHTRSILAQVSQAMELKLLYPIVELARQNASPDGFAITLYQYDGCSIACKAQKAAHWKKMIKEAVDAQAIALGVNTELLWKKDPGLSQSSIGAQAVSQDEDLPLAA